MKFKILFMLLNVVFIASGYLMFKYYSFVTWPDVNSTYDLLLTLCYKLVYLTSALSLISMPFIYMSGFFSCKEDLPETDTKHRNG